MTTEELSELRKLCDAAPGPLTDFAVASISRTALPKLLDEIERHKIIQVEVTRVNKEMLEEVEKLKNEIGLHSGELIGQEHRLGTRIDFLENENAKLRAALEWIMPNVHQAYHEGELPECGKPVCVEYKKALGETK